MNSRIFRILILVFCLSPIIVMGDISPVGLIYTSKIDTRINQLFKGKASSPEFYIFASFSLSDEILKDMVVYAEKYNAAIVFRGLIENSFHKTALQIQKIATEESNASILIDPPLFRQFGITEVPTYVLSIKRDCPLSTTCIPAHDKLIGNVTPKYALEKMAEKGDLKEYAKVILEGYK